jgi:DNA-binding transcriptional MerR regulator
MAKKEKERIRVVVDQEFKFIVEAYYTDPMARNISTLLNDRNQAIRSNIASYRQINSWDAYGLIDFAREGNEWRKYSIMDSLWLHIIHELRGFGYTVEQIKKVKKNLSENGKILNMSMPLLEVNIHIALSRKKRIILLVFADGFAAPIPYDLYKMNITDHKLDNHIYININDILERLYPGDYFKPIDLIYFNLNNEQYELLSFIQLGNYERVEINFKNKKMQTIEGLERLDANKRIVEILYENKYQKIEVIQKDGKIVSLVRKVKKKISE